MPGPRRRLTLQYVVFVLDEKNYIEYILPELKHIEFIYELICKDTRIPIALYLKTNWLHRLGYGIYEAANYKWTL